MESNLRGHLPCQPIENPEHSPQGFASHPNASMIHTQSSSSQGPQIEKYKETTRLRNGKSFPKVGMNQPKRVLSKLGDKEEKGDSNEKKEKRKGKQKITLEEDSFSDEDDSMNKKDELQWNETSNKLLDSKYDLPIPFRTALIPKLKPKKSLCNPKNETRTINLSAEVSAFISNTFPRKQKDPGIPLV